MATQPTRITGSHKVDFFDSFTEWRKKIALVFSAHLGILVEIGIIFAWAVFTGRGLLDFDPRMWPIGGEYTHFIRDNGFWANLFSCGVCAFWNGGFNGGFPALVDLQSAPLHPLISIPALIFGIINGSKVTIVLSLAMAGFAQWWLARLMGLGSVARVWVAMMAVTAGSLGGKMEGGELTEVLSTAAVLLVIPAGVNLARNLSGRATVVFGIAFALAIVSGQGYMQIGMVLSIFPALLVFLVDTRDRQVAFAKAFLQAMLVGLLLAGVFLVPLFHHYPGFIKEIDTSFPAVQPLEYLPLNLVIRDLGYYTTEVLGHLPYPYLYVNYIGWVPVLLAIYALSRVPKNHLRLLIFLLAGIALVYLNSTLVLPKLLLGQIFSDFLAGMRHPSVMAGIAAHLILALAAWGLDFAIHSGPWATVEFNESKPTRLRLTWLLLFIPLAWAVYSAYGFSSAWLKVAPVEADAYPVIDEIKLASTEWVELPFGEHYWSGVVMERGLKITNIVSPWRFRGREFPPARVWAKRGADYEDLKDVYTSVYGIAMGINEDVHYASLTTQNGAVHPCVATARGGWINVRCPKTGAGTVVVQENNLSGWTARIGGQRAPLEQEQWLSVKVEAGQDLVFFRYQPWDVPLGMVVSLIGVGLCGYLWRKEKRITTEDEEKKRLTTENTEINGKDGKTEKMKKNEGKEEDERIS